VGEVVGKEISNSFLLNFKCPLHWSTIKTKQTRYAKQQVRLIRVWGPPLKGHVCCRYCGITTVIAISAGILRIRKSICGFIKFPIISSCSVYFPSNQILAIHTLLLRQPSRVRCYYHPYYCQHSSNMQNLITLKSKYRIKMAVFWVTVPCSLVEVYRRFRGTCYLHHQGDDDWGSKHHWNVGKLLPDYTAQQLRIQSSSYLPPWEPQILHLLDSIHS
jgi:hypothetical protein